MPEHADEEPSQLGKTHVLYISFETLKKPGGVDVMVDASRRTPPALLKDIASLISQSGSSTTTPSKRRRISNRC